MHQNGFRSLSPQDFEDLVGDLLEADRSLKLERFSTGRDAGIDLRDERNGTRTIVQCKHRPDVTFATLLRDLKNAELEKVKHLEPDRYIVATSAGITPANKQVLFEAFVPFIREQADILGRDQIEALLRAHPSIERAHVKLWLTSAPVLERVLYNAEVTNAQTEVERIREKIPLFVATHALRRVEALLEDQRIAIVSGPPGIGKTTLADMLLYLHLEQGFEPVVLRNGVEEGRKLFNANRKQIFYFDDFLGQTFVGDQLDAVSHNHDQDLLAFMALVRRTSHSRFVLTTREHILQRARDLSERLAHEELIDERFVLQLDHYSFLERARILYNHFWFGRLGADYRDALLDADFFLEIVQHDNFNPRLIEWLTQATLLQQVAPATYQDHIRELLDRPEKLWEHAYRKQINEAARGVLLAMATLGDRVRTVDLKASWVPLHKARSQEFSFSGRAGEFKDALEQLGGSFLRIEPPFVRFAKPVRTRSRAGPHRIGR